MSFILLVQPLTMYKIGSVKSSNTIDEITLWVITYISISDDEMSFFRNSVKVKAANPHDNRKNMCRIEVFTNLDNSKPFLLTSEEMHDDETRLGKFDSLALDNNKSIANKENSITGGERTWSAFSIASIARAGDDDVFVLEKLLVFSVSILNIKSDESTSMEVKMLIKTMKNVQMDSRHVLSSFLSWNKVSMIKRENV